MIETVAGVAFLMSSLYGAGHANAENVADIASTGTGGIARSAMTRTLKDPEDIENYLREEFADTPILVEVARCESTFRQYGKNGQILRGLVNKADVGVMQINEAYHAEDAKKLGYDLYTIEGNVAMAKKLYARSGTSPWISSQPCWGLASGALAKN